MNPPRKLNIFQRGVLQEIFTALIAFVCLSAAMTLLILLDRERFLNNASINIIDLIVIAALSTVIGIAVVKVSSRVNFAWSVTLPKAVEFSSALRKLGILELKKQIAFVREHSFDVFIADVPILGDDQENVRAKLYPFVNNVLASESVFSTNIGKRTLCLDAGEYELLAEKVKKDEALKESVVSAAKNDEIKGLTTAVASLTQEIKTITKERDELRGKVRIQNAQETGRVERLRVERLLWIVFNSVIDRLIQDTPPSKGYTTPNIEAAFAAEWEQRADLREYMRRLTGSEEANPSEDFIKAVKAEFKDVGKLSTGGRPPKNP
jgi:hypothetical protein